MQPILRFASSSCRRSRRTHAALLAGLLFGLGAPGALAGVPGTPAVRALAGDSGLWATAARIALASRWMLPGRATIDEHSSQDAATTHTAITARLEDAGARAPRLTIEAVRINDEDKTQATAQEMTHGLSELVESLYSPDHPLGRHTPKEIRLAGETLIDGARCRGFATRTTTDGLNLESTTWIDVALGYARRIDYRAINLPLRKDSATIRALSGSTDYALDAGGRWILVRHSEHSDLKASSFLGSIELRSDKTIRCEHHWEYTGPRRKAPDRPADP